MPEFNEENGVHLFNSAEGDGGVPETAHTENPKEEVESISADDLKRLKNMDLDGIIEDVTTENVSVSDLFGNNAGDEEDAGEKQQKPDLSEIKVEKDTGEKKREKK